MYRYAHKRLHIHIWVYIYTYIHTYKHMHTHRYIYIYIFASVNTTTKIDLIPKMIQNTFSCYQRWCPCWCWHRCWATISPVTSRCRGAGGKLESCSLVNAGAEFAGTYLKLWGKTWSSIGKTWENHKLQWWTTIFPIEWSQCAFWGRRYNDLRTRWQHVCDDIMAAGLLSGR